MLEMYSQMNSAFLKMKRTCDNGIVTVFVSSQTGLVPLVLVFVALSCRP